MADSLQALFDALQQQLNAGLAASRSALTHPVAKGDASESNWAAVLEAHLPHRYQVGRAFVMDSQGQCSDQIDLVIFDRQYTPVLFNQNGQQVIPAESVYGVFEVRQELSKENLEYAGTKAESVRRLARTSAQIVHAGGEHAPRPPIPILAGILTYESSWNPALGDPLVACLRSLSEPQRLDLGCAIAAGSFDAIYSDPGTLHLETVGPERSLAYLMMRLLHRLQRVGTVAAIDYESYSRSLRPGT